MYNSIIQSTSYLRLQYFHVFQAICGFRPKKTAPAWRQPKNKTSQFLVTYFDVNCIPVRAFCIDRNKW